MANIAEVEKLALDLPETVKLSCQHTYWDRFHRCCATLRNTKNGRRSWCGATLFDCLHSSAVLSSACRLLCYVGYNGSFRAGSKPPEVAASWTVWHGRDDSTSRFRT